MLRFLHPRCSMVMQARLVVGFYSTWCAHLRRQVPVFKLRDADV